MRKGAVRTFDKVMQRCPYCGDRRPKELVEGPQRLNVVAYVLVALVTCGIGFLLYPAFVSRSLEVYCRRCDDVFPYR